MKRNYRMLIPAAALLIGTFAIAAKTVNNFAPGVRTLMLAHNAYPDHGKYGDRLDRAISAGVPFVVEEDLAWVDGKSLLVHGPKAAGQDDPTLESYFFPKIRPVIEKALKENKRQTWPVVTLYLDIKNDPVEHLEEVSRVLDRYNDWFSTAVKTADIAKQSPLDVRPMLVLVEDKQNDNNKKEVFYDRVPVGGKIRVFGSATKFDDNPKKLSRAEKNAAMPSIPVEQLLNAKADNYHRWFGTDWAFIELCGKQSKSWSPEAETRLKRFVSYGHSQGYLVSLYAVNGFSDSENQGWTNEFNFGSRAEAEVRWKAAAAAKADFIATDQYETLAAALASWH